MKRIRNVLSAQLILSNMVERRKNPRQLLENVVEYFKVFPIKGDVV